MTKEAKILIIIAGLVIIGGVLLAIFYNPQPQEPGQAVDGQSLIRDTSRMTKSASAKVNIVEFGDFQCPGCAALYPRIKQVLEEYKDKDVNFVFRNFPLEAIHPNAFAAAEAAETAGKLGKYWEMHELLYQRQNEWGTLSDPTDSFVNYAESLGLNGGEFKTLFTQHLFRDVIKADQKDGESVKVGSTPSVFINGVPMVTSSGVPTIEELKAKIDEALSK